MKNNYPIHLENMAADIYLQVVRLIAKRRIKKILSAYKADPVVKHLQVIRHDALREEIEKAKYSKALTAADLVILQRKFGRLDTAAKAYSAHTLNNSIDKMKADLKKKETFKFNIEQNLDSPELLAVREKYLESNMMLCEKLGNEYIADIGQAAMDAYLQGESTEALRDKFMEITDVTESKASFWARDQLGTAYSEYTKEMQTGAGIERYIWKTVGDNHVRDTHKILNGKVFNWIDGAEKTGLLDDGSGAKHPGEAYNCRCNADPTERPETPLEEIK